MKPIRHRRLLHSHLVAAGSLLAVAQLGTAAPLLKSPVAGTIDLTLADAWDGVNVPGAGDVATWDATSLGGTQAMLFNTATWEGIDIQTPAAGRVVTLTGKTAGQTLSLGASGVNVATLNTLAFTATGGNAPAIGVLGDQSWTLGGVGSNTGRILFSTGSTLTVDAAVSTGGWNIVLNNTATTVGMAALEFNATSGTTFDLSKAVISGAGSIHIRTNNKVVLGGANSFTGTVENRSGGDVDFSVLANAGTNSSFGAGTGNLFTISSNSATVLTNTGAGGSTNRSLSVLSQSAGGLSLLNNGTGAVSFLGIGTIGTSVNLTGGLILGGTYTGAANVLGQSYQGTTNTLSKQDASTWILSGANSYGGATTVTGGTLIVTGSITSATTVKSSATLAGTGTVGAVVVEDSGNLAPGTGSVATLNTGGVTIAGNYACDVSGSASDLLVITGDLILVGPTLVVGGTPTAGSYTIATVTGAITGTLAESVPGYVVVVDSTASPKTVKLVAESAGFPAWIAKSEYGLAPADQDPADDPDHDGVNNLTEYAIAGRNPAVPDGAPGSLSGGVATFTKRAEAAVNPKLSYRILMSDDLGLTDPWAEAPAGPDYANTASAISYKLPAGKRQTFARLAVTLQP